MVIQYNLGREKAENLAKIIEQTYKVRCIALKADVSDENSVKLMFDEIEKQFEAVDILVNNAGIAQQKLFTDITAEDWHKMIGVNLDGVFFCTKQVLKRFMLPQHSGVILNISSMWGEVGASCEVVYSATKGAVIALTKALAQELGPSGIRVNCVAPGVIATDMCAGIDPAILDEMAEESPVGRNGTPEDVAKAMLYLSDAEFVTGHVLSVNGGYVI